MTELINKKLNINSVERKTFWVLFITLIILSGSYGYLVNKTILNIVDRESIEENIITLNSKISESEFEYIALKNQVNIDYAYSLGFDDAKNMKFASRKLPSQSLSLRNE